MLKKLLAISFFLIIALRPAYTISYLLYFQLNIDAIVQKYCVNQDKPQMHCNGKCHLMKQLNFNKPKNTATNREMISFMEAFFPLYYQSNELGLLKPFAEFHFTSNFNYQAFKTSDFIFKIYHPPKVFIS